MSRDFMMDRRRKVDFTRWDVAKGKYRYSLNPRMVKGVAKSEEQIEATARELYARPGIKGGFVPQSQLNYGFVSIPVTVPQ